MNTWSPLPSHSCYILGDELINSKDKFNLRLWNSVKPLFCFKEREIILYYMLRNSAKLFLKKSSFFSPNGSPAGLLLGKRALIMRGCPVGLGQAGDFWMDHGRPPGPGTWPGTGGIGRHPASGALWRPRRELYALLRARAHRVPCSLPVAPPAINIQGAPTFCLRGPAN